MKTKQEKDFQDYMQMEKEMTHMEAQLKESKAFAAMLEKSTLLSRKLLKETIVVKLRYEAIIKELIKNEKQGSPRTVKEIIAVTKASEQEILRNLDHALPPTLSNDPDPKPANETDLKPGNDPVANKRLRPRPRPSSRPGRPVVGLTQRKSPMQKSSMRSNRNLSDLRE